jgi:hypothetical protein
MRLVHSVRTGVQKHAHRRIGTILCRRLEEHFVSKRLKNWDAQLKRYILKIVIACIFKLKLRSIGVERRFAQSVCPMVLNK